MLINMKFGREIFTLSPVAYITVNLKKLVTDLFHSSSALIGSESIKKKNEAIKIAPLHNNSLETFSYTKYRSTLQCISVTSGWNYPAKSPNVRAVLIG